MKTVFHPYSCYNYIYESLFGCMCASGLPVPNLLHASWSVGGRGPSHIVGQRPGVAKHCKMFHPASYHLNPYRSLLWSADLNHRSLSTANTRIIYQVHRLHFFIKTQERWKFLNITQPYMFVWHFNLIVKCAYHVILHLGLSIWSEVSSCEEGVFASHHRQGLLIEGCFQNTMASYSRECFEVCVLVIWCYIKKLKWTELR